MPASPDATVKVGDTSPGLETTLTNAAGNAIDLSGATVTFTMQAQLATTPKIAAASATIVAPATNGVVRYDWAAGDTDTPGYYDAEFIATYSDGTIESFPNGRHLLVYVHDDV